MIVDILLNALWHAVTFIGLVYFVGFIISLINRFFYKVTNYSKLSIYGTGFIGTPIHEASHLVMCLVFFHKVNEVKFFQINDADGVLGYVNHSWNPKNIYQQIGNYFIGVAPIVVGTLVIFFGMKYLLPNTFEQINSYFSSIQALGANVNMLECIPEMFTGMISAMFSEVSIGWQWWVFMVASICIALHMSLSGADIRGSLVAIPILLFIILAVNLVLGFLTGAFYNVFLGLMNTAGSFIISVLMLSLVLSALCLALALLMKGVVLIFKKIFRC